MVQKLAAIVGWKIQAAAARLRGGPYSRKFFAQQDEIATRAAEVVVPLVINLVKPRSVVDVGCGSGSWLAVFAAHGVDDILGIDSDDVPSDILRVPSSALLRKDLALPFTLDRTFDLAVCLEVAEHIYPEAGNTIVSSLTGASRFVLFSAAIPRQGGTRHVNEQWPDYWADLFARHGYIAVDCLRRKVWRHPAVAWWYAQNMLLFAEQAAIRNYPEVQAEFELMGTSQLSIVHPRCYEGRRRALRHVVQKRARSWKAEM